MAERREVVLDTIPYGMTIAATVGAMDALGKDRPAGSPELMARNSAKGLEIFYVVEDDPGT